ncbi:MAG: hypothetical protein ABL989_07720 [Gammaproteobacteria bacterium]
MKVALDEHVPPAVGRGLVAMLTAGGDGAVTIVLAKDYATGQPAPDDVPWITKFAADGGTVIISGDKAIRSVPEVQRAVAETGVIAFYLPSRWNHWDMARRSAFILSWWERILAKARESESGSAWIIPAGWEDGAFREVTVPDPEGAED